MTYEGWSSQGAWALALFIDNDQKYQERVLTLVRNITSQDKDDAGMIEEFSRRIWSALPPKHTLGGCYISKSGWEELFNHFIVKLEDMECHELGPGYDFADEVAGDESDGVYHAIAWEWEEGGW